MSRRKVQSSEPIAASLFQARAHAGVMLAEVAAKHEKSQAAKLAQQTSRKALHAELLAKVEKADANAFTRNYAALEVPELLARLTEVQDKATLLQTQLDTERAQRLANEAEAAHNTVFNTQLTRISVADEEAELRSELSSKGIFGGARPGFTTSERAVNVSAAKEATGPITTPSNAL